MFNIARSDITLSPSPSLKGLGLGGSTARACMLADLLGWSARRGIPLQTALTGLPFYRRLDLPFFGLLFGMGWLLGPCAFMMPLPWLIDVSWSYRVRRLARHLDRGEKLAKGLRRCFPGVFPEFYLLGIEKAEVENCLGMALPVLAHQLNYPYSIARERTVELAYTLGKVLVAVGILAFIATNIAPRWQLIFADLSESNAVLPFQRFTGVIAPAAQVLAGVVLFFMLLPGLGVFGDFVMIHLPVVGGSMKRFALGDLARSMAAFLRQGDTMLAATEWSRRATRSRWLGKRLDRCIEQMRKGVRWEEAWASMNVGRPLDQWVIANSAMREDPASGFELLAEWLHEDVERSTRRLERWVDPLVTLVLAMVIGGIAYYTFSSLITNMYSLM